MTLPDFNRQLPTGGTLYLDVNAPLDTDFDRSTGWSVYVVRTAAGEMMPQFRDWVSFRDLTPASGIIGSIDAASLGGAIHVFWTEVATVNGILRHIAILPDGTIGPTATVETNTMVFSEISAIVHRGEVNVFYCVWRNPPALQGGSLLVLRRAVLDAGGMFHLSDIDGEIED
jgi:hypothetical protein